MSTRCDLSLVDRFADGELDAEAAARFRDHLGTCRHCQAALLDRAQLDALVEDAEPLWQSRPHVVVPLRPRRRWPAAVTLGLGVAAAAALLLVLWPRRPGPDTLERDREVVLALGPTRPIEARLSGADRYRPFDAARGAGPQAAERRVPLEPASRLEKRGDFRTLAAAFALRGDAGQALAYLDSAGEAPAAAPDVESDRAAISLGRDQLEDALTRLDRALRAAPHHAQALWNRALVLRQLGLPLAAAAGFDAVATLGEPGWSSEAAGRAAELRAATVAARKEWEAARDAGAAMVAGGPPLDGATVRRFPGLSRLYFYDAARAATSRQRAESLAPMAAALDALGPGHTLDAYLRTVAAADFTRRRPLAEAYAPLVAAERPAPPAVTEPLLERIRRADQPDILMGALLHTDRLRAHLDEYQRLAAATADPWFLALARHEQARAQLAEGKLLEAEQTLLAALADCRKDAVEYRCARIEDELAVLYTSLYRPVEAVAQARAEWDAARRGHEWGIEVKLLQTLSQIASFRSNLPLARAYLDEAELREPERCEVRRSVGIRRAALDVIDTDYAAARREIDATPRCGEPLPVLGAMTLGDLARIDGTRDEAQRVRAELAAQAPRLDPGKRRMASVVEGSLLLAHSPAEGRAHLRALIAEIDAGALADPDSARARAQAYSALAMEAGRDQRFDEVLALLAGEVGAAAPARCVLGAATAEERALVVVRGTDGVAHGTYQTWRAGPGELRPVASRLVPDALRQPLAGCDSVAVFARPPLQGSPDLLPPGYAWSYRVGSGSPHPAGAARDAAAPRRVVVADVEPPPALHLPRIGASLRADDGTPTALLRGGEATPGRVLAEIEDATEIEFHTHGLVDLGLSEVSHLVLSPDADGRYALTAGALREHRLRRSPLVVLGACHAGEPAPWLHQAWSLPAAFIGAGAGAVLAATGDVEDAGAGEFFSSVRARIARGQTPAAALRDERVERQKRDPRSWTATVLLFERAEGVVASAPRPGRQ